MRVNMLVACAIVAALGLGGGWVAGNIATPYIVTDGMLATFAKNGAKPNRLSPGGVRTAKTARVVMDNADTITRSAKIDLSGGPVIFEAMIPENSVYWSVSLFAHNTDTYFVANDSQIAPERFRLAIRTANQSVPEGMADDEAVSPSKIGFLIIRATMHDRNDPAAVDALMESVRQSSLAPLNPADATNSGQ